MLRTLIRHRQTAFEVRCSLIAVIPWTGGTPYSPHFDSVHVIRVMRICEATLRFLTTSSMTILALSKRQNMLYRAIPSTLGLIDGWRRHLASLAVRAKPPPPCGKR